MNGLPALANNLAAKGRGGDSMLMHVSPGEVQGLQALAMANGTSLSINPETGLPEAFSLKKILPTVVGTAVGVATGNPWLGAAIAGVGSYAQTGSLAQGIAAGAGAYGLTGLGSGLAAAAPSTTVATQVPAAAAGTTLGTGAMSNIAASPLAAAPLSVPGAAAVTPGIAIPASSAVTTAIPAGATAPAATPLAFKSALPAAAPATAATTPLAIKSAALPAATAAPGTTIGVGGMADLGANVGALYPPPPAPPTGLAALEQAGAGFKNILSGDELARQRFMESVGGGSGLIQKGLMGSAPFLMAGGDEPWQPPGSDAMIRPYTLEVDNLSGQEPYSLGDTRERRQIAYRFVPGTPYKAAGGGLVSFQEGGEADVAPTTQTAYQPTLSPATARVLQNVALVQGLAGLPAIDISGLPAGQVAPAPQPVYTPRPLPSTREMDYGIAIPKPEDTPTFEKAKEAENAGGLFGGLFGRLAGGSAEPNPVIGYTSSGEAIYQNRPSSGLFPFFGGGYAPGGSVNAFAAGDALPDGSFVADARMVSEVGNGSSEAGAEILERLGGKRVRGPGHGVSDDVPVRMSDGREGRVARDEVVFSPEAVQRLGGSKRLYAMMDRIHEARKKAKRGEDTKIAEKLVS